MALKRLPGEHGVAAVLRDVVVRHGPEFALRLDRLELGRGETTAVVGPSGAGKSTLLHVLAGLRVPDSGALHWATRTEGRAPRSALLFQKPRLLRGTVLDNLRIIAGLKRSRVDGASISSVVERLRLEPLLKRGVRSLSGGEYQRVSLARVLLLRPEVLLLDEPTAQLDPAGVATIERLVQEEQGELGMTVVWVTHNPAQARRIAHSVLLLVAGERVEHSGPGVFFGPDASPRTRDFLSGRMIW